MSLKYANITPIVCLKRDMNVKMKLYQYQIVYIKMRPIATSNANLIKMYSVSVA